MARTLGFLSDGFINRRSVVHKCSNSSYEVIYIYTADWLWFGSCFRLALPCLAFGLISIQGQKYNKVMYRGFVLFLASLTIMKER